MNLGTPEYKAWLESLEPGDTVFLAGRYSYSARTRATVEKVTRTQLVVRVTSAYTIRFRRDTGRPLGDPHGDYLLPDTPENRAQVKAAEYRARFTSLANRARDLPDATIARMLAAHDSPRAEHPEDLIVWPDGYWCRREELPHFQHKSDDCEAVPYGTGVWQALTGGDA